MKFRFAVFSALVSALLVQQAIAAAPASNVDPARDRIGQIVYPLGVHPPKDTGKTKGVAAKYPRAQGTTRDKSRSDEE